MRLGLHSVPASPSERAAVQHWLRMTALADVRTTLTDYDDIAAVVAYLAPVAAVCGTVGVYLAGLTTFAVVSLYATVPIVVASGTALAAERVSTVREAAFATSLTPAGLRLTVAAYLAVHALSLLVASAGAVRPYAYYGLVALAAAIVLFQVLHSEPSRGRVAVYLTETAALLATLLWSVTLKYRYFFGRTDVFPHHSSVDSLLATGHVTGAFGEYQAFPLWHVFMGFQRQLYGGTLDTLGVFFVTTGVLFAVATVAVYAVGRRFALSRTVSLVAALGMCAMPFVVLYGMYSIPRSVTAVLFLFSLLALLLDDRRGTVVFLAFTVGTAAYHTVSLPFVFVTLAAYYAAERLLGARSRRSEDSSYVVSTGALLAVPVVQVVYWGVVDPALVERLVSLVTESATYGLASETGGLTTQFIESPLRELANYAAFGLLLLFVVFAVVRSAAATRLSRRGECVLLAALLLVGLSFPGPVLLVSVVSNVTADNVLRFGQYTYPFVVLAFGVGVVSAVRTGAAVGDRRVALAVVLVLAFSTVFLGVSNDFVASDNPVVERDDFYTFYLSGSEVTSVGTLTETSEAPVTSDYVTCRYVDHLGNGECGIIQANPVTGALYTPPDSVLVLRDVELADRPLSVFPTDERVADPPYSNFRESLPASSQAWSDLADRHRVYDSSSVSGYVAN